MAKMALRNQNPLSALVYEEFLIPAHSDLLNPAASGGNKPDSGGRWINEFCGHMHVYIYVYYQHDTIIFCSVLEHIVLYSLHMACAEATG